MPAKTPKNILIVEDEKPTAQALQLKLQRSGFAAAIVTNGTDALEALLQRRYSLIILDLIVPQLDGFSFLAAMKDRGDPTPVIVVSNLSQPEDMARAAELGAKHFFVKSETTLAAIVNAIKKTLTP
ncbi:MAG: response regulator [Candidatus Kerfeldbacteria bacterium]|nr:response regulator [Candidatus Kerfeldbacteria bacterium]